MLLERIQSLESTSATLSKKVQSLESTVSMVSGHVQSLSEQVKILSGILAFHHQATFDILEAARPSSQTKGAEKDGGANGTLGAPVDSSVLEQQALQTAIAIEAVSALNLNPLQGMDCSTGSADEDEEAGLGDVFNSVSNSSSRTAPKSVRFSLGSADEEERLTPEGSGGTGPSSPHAHSTARETRGSAAKRKIPSTIQTATEPLTKRSRDECTPRTRRAPERETVTLAAAGRMGK